MEHLRRHPDMRFACFQPTLPEARKAREQELIRQVREVFPTRNIKHALSTRAFVPFDKFIGPSEREAFLRSNVIEDDPDKWQELPLLTQKQRGRYEKFNRMPQKDKILEGILLFVWSIIPRPRILENRFWSLTLFPSPHIVRVNVGQQELFTILKTNDGELIARALTLRASGPEAEGPVYKSDSYVDCFSLEDLSNWLLDEERLWSCRELAIQLMRHTTALNNGSHCPQVVRAAWEWHKTNPTPPLSEGQEA